MFPVASEIGFLLKTICTKKEEGSCTVGSNRLAYKHSNTSLPLTDKENKRMWSGWLKGQIFLQHNSMIYKILCKFSFHCLTGNFKSRFPQYGERIDFIRKETWSAERKKDGKGDRNFVKV